MPLVIVCGVPCSGKTKRTNEIREILTRNGQEVHIVNDELCSIKYADYGSVENFKLVKFEDPLFHKFQLEKRFWRRERSPWEN